MGVLGSVIIAVAVMAIVLALFGWDRCRVKRKDAGDDSTFQATSEVFIDPTIGHRTRVWYNPKTGQREYCSEPEGSLRRSAAMRACTWAMPRGMPTWPERTRPLVASALVGGDWIDDVDVLRSGCASELLGTWVPAPFDASDVPALFFLRRRPAGEGDLIRLCHHQRSGPVRQCARPITS